MKTQAEFVLYCREDDIPFVVSLHEENHGAAFSLNDPDNYQDRQVLLSYSDTLKLYEALKAFLER